MTSPISSIFKQSLLVTAMGLALAACGGGNGLSNDGSTPPPTGPVDPTGPTGPAPSPDIEVRDFGGINGKIVWDANRDSFAVGTDGKFYVYNAALGDPDPDSDLIPKDRLARVRGIKVTDDDAIFRGEEQLGSIVTDQDAEGRTFSVLGFDTGTEQGYLDVDFNSHYGGVTKTDKTDPRITQVHAVAAEHSFRGLRGESLWQSKDGELKLGANRKTLPVANDDLNFSFKSPTSENYHFVLREYDYANTDLDIRLVDVLTGRILASSYGTLNGELISFPLTKDATYGINVRRSNKATEDAAFLLSIKQSADVANSIDKKPGTAGSTEKWIVLPNLTAKGSSITLRGTIHPVTRFEFHSRFPAIDKAISDATSDSLFKAVRDASGDATDDATDDGFSDPISENQKNVDYFSFQSLNTSAVNWAAYTFDILSEGGNSAVHYVRTKLADITVTQDRTIPGLNGVQKHYESPASSIGDVKYEMDIGEYTTDLRKYTESTIEYEMVIERK